MPNGPIVTADHVKAGIRSKVIFTVDNAVIGQNTQAILLPEGTYQVVDPQHRLVTICVLVMENGTQFVGSHRCLLPEHYDKETSELLSYQSAFSQAVKAEEYLLMQDLKQGKELINGVTN